MGKEKAGFLTPKAISNRIKSKGLQKLRWYCQMCQKQCRDENGFKCHLTSEAHQRQLLIFAENPGQFMGNFSGDFKTGYLDILRRQFGGKRVHCNVIYQEYIKEKDHVHMNSTKWQSLTGFVRHCGEQGICKIDHTEKGWFLEYIEKDPEKDRRVKSRDKLDLTLEERQRAQVEKQMLRDRERLAAEGRPAAGPSQPTALAEDAPRLSMRLGDVAAATSSASTASATLPSNALQVAARAHQDRLERGSVASSSGASSVGGASRKRSALEDVMREEEGYKERRNRKAYWLAPGIVVKLMSKALPAELRKRKAVVLSVEESHYTGVVRVLEEDGVAEGATLRVDQSHVETVIPRPGRAVLLVNGAYRGKRATLTAIREASFSCELELSEGLLAGRKLDAVPYEDISKWHGLPAEPSPAS